VTLGVPLDGSVGFVWDNEGPPSAPQSVADFLAASTPVSVADFYVFAIAERGYSDSAWWQEEDWQHMSKTGQVRFTSLWFTPNALCASYRLATDVHGMAGVLASARMQLRVMS